MFPDDDGRVVGTRGVVGECAAGSFTSLTFHHDDGVGVHVGFCAAGATEVGGAVVEAVFLYCAPESELDAASVDGGMSVVYLFVNGKNITYREAILCFYF